MTLVGGASQAPAGARDGVWSWTGARWDLRTAAGPAARNNAAAAFDAAQQLALVAGGSRPGQNAATVISDTWLGRAGWSPLATADFDPRDHLALVYDGARNAIIMFGGMPPVRSSPWPTDTWQFGPGGWTRILTGGPAGRARAALAYDAARNEVVLFGGVGASPGQGQPQPFFNDTWVLREGRWRQAATSGPRGRYAHGMVFDEKAGVVLLYSGAAAHRDAPLTDMWRWDGTRWTEIPLPGATPGYRYQPVMVYDRARQRTVLYGGLQSHANDTWEWDGREWRQAPAPR